MKRVIVNGYTYETDMKLKVGDRVLLPSPFTDTWEGIVDSLKSDYTGHCSQVIKKLRKKRVSKKKLTII
jgi:hypothetical protein